MGLRVLLATIILFNCNFSYADCPKNVQPIKQGQTANCDGFLFSPSSEESAYKDKELASLYKSENEILQERLELYMKQSDVLANNVSDHDTKDSLIRLGYFSLGAILTGLIASRVGR